MLGATIADVLKTLANADLGGISPKAAEREVGLRLSRSLAARFGTSARPESVSGVDGSVRNPDYALMLPKIEHGPGRNIAIEYKLYRSRKQGAGEMDRGLGQCIAYAERYDAVVLATIYMANPKKALPPHWTCQDSPLWIERNARRVPVYFVARPLSWSEDWAGHFGHIE